MITVFLQQGVRRVRVIEGNVMMEAETEGREPDRSDVIAGFENGGRCHEPRNANGVQKLVEARKYIPL